MIKPLILFFSRVINLHVYLLEYSFKKSISTVQMTNDDRVKEYLIPHYFTVCCTLQLAM